MYVHSCAAAGADECADQFFDLSGDPESLVNRVDDPACAADMAWCRRRLAFLKDRTPAAQLQWAPYGINQ
jgi:hypothetical protein